MKKRITHLVAVLFGMMLSTTVFAGIDLTTAWWNNVNFEDYELGYEFSGEVIDTLGTIGTESGWYYNVPYLKIMQRGTGDTIPDISKVLALTAQGEGNNIFSTESSLTKNTHASMRFNNDLSGLVYVKMDLGSWSRQVVFSLKYENDLDSIYESVFYMETPTVSANDMKILGTKTGWGTRKNFYEIEFVLDLDNSKLVKYDVNNGAYTTTDIAFPNDSTFKINTVELKVAVTGNTNIGISNMTIANFFVDKLGYILGEEELQTEAETISSTYNVQVVGSTPGNMGDVAVEDPTANIVWSITDYAGLDPGMFTLKQNDTDSREVKLDITGFVSTTTNIVLQATLNGAEIAQKTVTLKEYTVESLKTILLDEIAIVQAAVPDFAFTRFTMALKNKLIAEIATAQAVYDNAELTVADVFVSINTLREVLEEYNEAIEKNDALAADLVAAEDYIESVQERIGTGFLMYKQEVVDALDEAYTAGYIVYAGATTLEAIEAGAEVLNEALNTFTTTPRVAPTSTEYEIYTYGAASGEDGTEKIILYIDGYGKMRRAIKETLDTMTTSIPLGPNAHRWAIRKTVTENTGETVYMLKNIESGKFLGGNNTTLVDSTGVNIQFRFVENIGSSGESYIDPSLFFYSMENVSTSRVLRTNANNGFDLITTGMGQKLGYCFQFEPVGEPIVEEPGASVDDIKAKQKLKAYILNNKLVVTGVGVDEPYAIYTVTGMLIKSGKASSTRLEIPLSDSGLYIIKVSNAVCKVIK